MKHDPTPPLLASKSEALRYFARRDLVGEEPGSMSRLWLLPAVQRIIESQQQNGSWKYHGGSQRIRSTEDYDQIETFRVLRELVEKYGMTKDHHAMKNAAEFMFSHQTDEGDFRGIAGNQYIPYYSGAIMELLIKAGYANDERVKKGFDWLLSIHQDDGGWAFPMRTVGRKLDSRTFALKTIQPDRTRPFSHLVTGMVLRAFAAHPAMRKSEDAKRVALMLASRFFQPDKYPDRQNASFWTSFSYPFWFTDLLSSLDSISRISLETHDSKISQGIRWFIARQESDGLWRLPLRIMAKEEEPNNWVTLAICRVLKRV